jgi:hypothetical protein
MSTADLESAYFTAAPRNSWNEGTQYTFVQYYQLVAGQWQLQTDRYVYPGSGLPTSIATVSVSAPSMPSCDPAESFTDGAVLGWGIASALVAVAALKLIQRGA